jgi:VanZ family protein
MPTDKRLRALSLLLAALLAATLFATAPAAGGMIVPPWDKLAHFAFYGGIATLLAAGLGRNRLPLAFALTCLVGIADESYQATLPGRQAELADLLVDFAAAATLSLAARAMAAREP